VQDKLTDFLLLLPVLAPLRAVFPAVQSVRLRGRTGRTTPHNPSFWGVLGRTAPGKVRTGRTVGDYSPSAWTSGTGRSRKHTPPNQSL